MVGINDEASQTSWLINIRIENNNVSHRCIYYSLLNVIIKTQYILFEGKGLL